MKRERQTVALGYAGVAGGVKKYLTRWRYAVLLVGVCLEVAAAVCVGAAADSAAVALMLGGAALFFCASFFGRRSNLSGRQRAAARASDEAERAAEILAIAAAVYADGPVGRWVYRYVHWSSTSVDDERVLFLNKNGTGTFHWFLKDAPEPVATLFEFKAAAKGAITVRIVSPPVEGWHTVTYKFSTGKAHGGDPPLDIKFDGHNPLAESLGMFWPFYDVYRREAGG